MAQHLVTGGNGYVGSFLTRSLLARGEQVRVLDVHDAPERDPASSFVETSVLDRDGMARAMEGVDFVHHNAALVPLRKAGTGFWDVNVEGTRIALETAKAAGVKHFCHMSSSAIFGSLSDADCPVRDDSPLNSAEIYGRSKEAGDDLVRAEMARPDGLSCSTIRPRTIIGTERLGIFQILFEWISEGRNVYVIGDGSNGFQFVHIDDLINVSIESALQQAPGVFNVGTDRYGTLREALETLCAHAGTGSKVRGIPVWMAISTLWTADKLRLSPLAPWHYLTYHKPFYFDVTTTKEKLGWKPQFSNDEMLAHSYDWFLANRQGLREQGKDDYSAHKSRVKQGVIGVLKKFS